ncbi:hypothetical protein M408DRAFT_138717 [Serendipita vermifera MAFF 305830]|uniref:Uncharacterized protein n=1 Tax=Serendipita vermifera MAFF 305830 TaxID=933852 RepID=A0A0C2WS00_SERVB|nr:hypothetical protein M408DRAFT_138717 [Serendipita vermifera MAFF 305830]
MGSRIIISLKSGARYEGVVVRVDKGLPMATVALQGRFDTRSGTRMTPKQSVIGISDIASWRPIASEIKDVSVAALGDPLDLADFREIVNNETSKTRLFNQDELKKMDAIETLPDAGNQVWAITSGSDDNQDEDDWADPATNDTRAETEDVCQIFGECAE